MAQSFFPNPFLPLNIAGSHLPISVASPHLGEPPNGMKQLKRESQWEFSQAFFLNDDKSKHSFYPNKSKPKGYYFFNTVGSKAFFIDQKPVTKSTQNSI